MPSHDLLTLSNHISRDCILQSYSYILNPKLHLAVLPDIHAGEHKPWIDLQSDIRIIEGFRYHRANLFNLAYVRPNRSASGVSNAFDKAWAWNVKYLDFILTFSYHIFIL